MNVIAIMQRDAAHADEWRALKYDENACERMEDESVKSRQIVAGFIAALQNIAAIEDEMVGGDWDEIERARAYANLALAALNIQTGESES